MRTLGIDEAGRGPVLGNMVLAGVITSIENEKWLKSLGVKDSKEYGSSEKGKNIRKDLSLQIKEKCPYFVISIPSTEIDEAVIHTSLNKLEQKKASEIIHSFDRDDYDQVVLDGERIFKPICNDHTFSYNKADSLYVSVAAASILAKVERDESLKKQLEKSSEVIDDIRGGGYPNAQTFKFLKEYYKLFNSLPEFLRKSYRWKVLDAFMEEDANF